MPRCGVPVRVQRTERNTQNVNIFREPPRSVTSLFQMNKSNLEIIEALYEAFARRDVPTILNLVSPEIRITQSPALPWGGRYSGYSGLNNFFTSLVHHVDSVIHIERAVDAGENIVVVGRTKGFVRANGLHFDVSLAHVWKIRNGRITRLESYIENETMLAALNGRAAASVSAN